MGWQYEYGLNIKVPDEFRGVHDFNGWRDVDAEFDDHDGQLTRLYLKTADGWIGWTWDGTPLRARDPLAIEDDGWWYVGYFGGTPPSPPGLLSSSNPAVRYNYAYERPSDPYFFYFDNIEDAPWRYISAADGVRRIKYVCGGFPDFPVCFETWGYKDGPYFSILVIDFRARLAEYPGSEPDFVRFSIDRDRYGTNWILSDSWAGLFGPSYYDQVVAQTYDLYVLDPTTVATEQYTGGTHDYPYSTVTNRTWPALSNTKTTASAGSLIYQFPVAVPDELVALGYTQPDDDLLTFDYTFQPGDVVDGLACFGFVREQWPTPEPDSGTPPLGSAEVSGSAELSWHAHLKY